MMHRLSAEKQEIQGALPISKVLGKKPFRPDSKPAARWTDFFLIFCLCIVVYANSFAVGWISDDTRFITSNVSIKTISNAGRFFADPHGTTASTTGYEGIYRPLRTLSFAVDYSIWRLKPFGFHLTNLFVHFVASALVFLVCSRLNLSKRAGLAAGMLFAVHPAQVEAVTWISSRADGMAAIFMLTSFLFFLQSRAGRSSRFALLAASFTAFMLALLSKETAIVLPLLLIAYDVFFKKSAVLSRRVQVLEHSAFIVGAIVYFLGRAQMLHTVSQQGYWGGSLLATVLTMARCFWIYLKLVFLPPMTNCMEYLVPIARLVNASVLPFLFFWIFVAGVFVVWRISSVAGFGFAWFLIALAPVSNVFPISMLMAERFLYVPLIGVCVAAAAFFDKAGASSIVPARRFSNAAVCIIVALFGVISIGKNSAWVHPEKLWTQTLAQYPESYRARMGLANTYYERGQSLEAIKQYTKALQIFPNSQVLHDMGNAYRQMGDFDSAIAAYNSALALDPMSSWTHTSLGITYMLQKRLDRASEEFRRALEINPTYPIAHFYLGSVLEEKGQLDLALKEYKMVLLYAPDREDARRQIIHLEERLKSH